MSINHVWYRQVFSRLCEWSSTEFLLQQAEDNISRSAVISKPPIIFHIFTVCWWCSWALKEPSWWIDVFWVFQGLFSACLFYFLVCTCVVHKRCHHLIVTACTCQNNTNKNDLKVKSCWLFWVIILCLGCLGCPIIEFTLCYLHSWVWKWERVIGTCLKAMQCHPFAVLSMPLAVWISTWFKESGYFHWKTSISSKSLVSLVIFLHDWLWCNQNLVSCS